MAGRDRAGGRRCGAAHADLGRRRGESATIPRTGTSEHTSTPEVATGPRSAKSDSNIALSPCSGHDHVDVAVADVRTAGENAVPLFGHVFAGERGSETVSRHRGAG